MERIPGKSPGKKGRRGDRPDASRGLGDVLHFFISDDEQAEARGRAAEGRSDEPDDVVDDAPLTADPDPQTPPAPIARLVPALRGARWCIVASPNRVIEGSLAVDIGATLARAGSKTRILSSFEPSALLPSASSVNWECIPELADGSGALRVELERLERTDNLLVVLPPTSVATGLRGLRTDDFDGVLLPVDASSPGLSRALEWLRRFGTELQHLRMGTALVGAREDADAALLLRKLTGAALRQHGLELERLGTLYRDPGFDRSLLLGRALAEIDSDGPGTESLEALCEKLR